MLTYIFMRLLNISITAGWIVLAVILVRLLLKKAPKWISCLLWAVVGIRLILPFSIESVLSLIPSANTVEPGILLQRQPMVNTGFDSVNSVVNPIISDTFAPEIGASVNPLQIWGAIAALIWVVGIFAMIVYTLITYIRLRMRVSTAVRFRDNIYQSERVSSPFILGIFRPRIYLPWKTESEHIIAHEKAHLKRGDHFIKPIAFMLLAVYWFNPLMWVAYILLCRDIELACDEKVIRSMKTEEKQDYSRTLLEFSIKRVSIAACPLAFGEVGVKSRVKSVMNYKKPAFWIIIAALVVCAIVSVCFLTDPVNREEPQIQDSSDTDTDEVKDPDKIDMDLVENARYFELIYSGNIVRVVMEEETAYIKEMISAINISDEEISLDRNETRPADYIINCYDENRNYTSLNFNIGCREVWQNDYVKPTFSYSVYDPETVKEIFKHNYTDPAVIQYDNVEQEILKHNRNAYYKGDVGVTVYRELITEGKEGKMFVYLWVLYGEYIRNDDNTVENISGGSGPVRITFEKNEDGYYCTEYYSPEKGYEESFPQAALDAIDKLDIDKMRSELDQKAEHKLTGISYAYKDGDTVIKNATLTLWGKDNFQFTYSMLSSNLCIGKYTKEDGKLILREDGTDNVYTFTIKAKDTDTLIFDAENSTALPKYKYSSNGTPEECVPDGAVFNAVYNLYDDMYNIPVEDIEEDNAVTNYYAGEEVNFETDLQDRCVVTIDRTEKTMLFRGCMNREKSEYDFVRSGPLVINGDKAYFDHTADSRYVFDIIGNTLIFNAQESDDSEFTVSDKTVFRLWEGEPKDTSSDGEANTDGVKYILTVNDLEITDNKVYIPSDDLVIALVQKISDDVAYNRVEGNFLSTPMNKTILDIDYPFEESGRDGTVVTSMDYLLKNVPAGTTVCVTITKELQTRLGLESDVVEIITVKSLIYSEEDIDSAINIIKDEVEREWQACTLNDIYYAGDDISKQHQDWADRHNADEVIVLLSSFDVDSSGGDGSLNPNSTYDNWMWILVQTDGGTWQHVDHGY